VVVEDDIERFPSFSSLLYGSLDYSLMVLYILLFIVLQEALGFNSMLSVFCVYILEKVLREVRSELGQSNLS
jgi:hypothetical protein